MTRRWEVEDGVMSSEDRQKYRKSWEETENANRTQDFKKHIDGGGRVQKRL